MVADTNVLVSALLFPGGPTEVVYRLAIEQRIELVSSTALLAELARVLTSKFGWDAVMAEQAVELIVRIELTVSPGQVVTDIVDDPTDNRVLEAAVAAGADAIVSGDRHLLQLTTWHDIPIVTPTTLLDILDA